MEYKITKRLTKKVIKEIIEIKNKKGLTAETIIEKATNKKNPLHSFFDWKDTEAAQKWRLHQARLLINEIKVIVEDKQYYAFENVNVSVSNKKEYVSREEILTNEDLRQQIVQRVFQQLVYWKEQYESYKEFSNIVIEIEKTQKKLNTKKVKAYA